MGRKTHQIARMGIGYVPEDRRVFPTLTVRQNLLIGMKSGNAGNNGWTIEKVCTCFSPVEGAGWREGRDLVGGRAANADDREDAHGQPELILVDEPTEGLAPQIVETVAWVIGEIHESGVSVFLVEQSIEVVLGLISAGTHDEQGGDRFHRDAGGTEDEA